MTLSLQLPDWSSTTWLTAFIGVISALRLTYWQFFVKDNVIAVEKAKQGVPSAADNGGVPAGPRGWPLVGNLLTLGHEPHRALADLAQIYGDVLQVQLGAFPTLVVSSMSLAKEVLVKQAAHFGAAGEPIRIVELGLGWNRPQLAAKRGAARALVLSQALSGAFKSAQTAGLVSKAIHEVSEELVTTVKEELGDAATNNKSGNPQITGLRSLLRRAALNVLLKVAFGVRIAGDSWQQESGGQPGQPSGSVAMLEVILSEMWQLVNNPVLADHVPLLRLATGALTTRCRFLARQRDCILRDLVGGAKKAREQASSGDGKLGKSLRRAESLLDALLAGQETSGLTDGEVADVLADFVQRGVLPVAATVEWALAELTRNPEIQKRLNQELEVEVFGKGGDVPRQALARTPLLSAIILETLRLHPTQPLSRPRRAAEDVHIDGYRVTKRQNVVINTWALGRDARLFRSASDFVPERFSQGALSTLLDAKDLYWSSLRVDETDVLIDIAAYFLGVLVRGFEWLPGLMHESRLSLQESSGVEVSELVSAVAPCAKIR
ncbi:cytochrome P450 family 1 subfamily A polypeptide 1 [Klebsormidium nitens]|uniref:Cytochrome P450 family 1 subfamily A polypeptide 1 n=1 Tax=Klebsormidium nitens TaxID=105231 RepID=A0A1Y1I6U6_KLENI|nr:cytochrome P450 family 1 subfamily A polypeptide 1 [Klebsormidium nitens]|eukprot:GAQ84861.1 cytochrome P450 family 1 subfamily A polypeptide 1 [Klebsormidium nitens]